MSSPPEGIMDGSEENLYLRIQERIIQQRSFWREAYLRELGLMKDAPATPVAPKRKKRRTSPSPAAAPRKSSRKKTGPAPNYKVDDEVASGRRSRRDGSAKRKDGAYSNSQRFKGKEDHSTEGVRCSHCNVLFTTKGDLEDHLAKGTTEGCRGGKARTPAAASSSYSCEDCPKKFTSNSGLYRHRQSVHLQKVHPCTVEGCLKTFTQVGHRLVHIKTIHEGAKPFKCWRCGVSFSHKHNLKRHETFMHTY